MGVFKTMDELKNARKVVGFNQTIRAIEEQQAKMVYVAKDADAKLISQIEKLCDEQGVQFIKVESMKLLGKACGIDVKAAMACIIA